MPSRGVEEMRREIMLNRTTAYLSHVSEKNRCLAPNHDQYFVLPYLTAKFHLEGRVSHLQPFIIVEQHQHRDLLSSS
jgi:hypothetical protein